jgi:hypothetical protein
MAAANHWMYLSLNAERLSCTIVSHYLLQQFSLALRGFRGGGQQSGQESFEQGFALASGIVHELEESEIVGQFLLRDTAVRPQ